MAADLDFFFDPVCPWAWITSRWVVNVAEQRDYEVDWRFISLWIVNEETTKEWYTPEYRQGHYRGHQGLRIADAIRAGGGGAEEVGRWYTTLGTALHVESRRDEAAADIDAFLRELLDGERVRRGARRGRRRRVARRPHPRRHRAGVEPHGP